MKESKLYKLLRPLIKIFTNIVYRPTYIGLENIPKNKRIIIAGNHTNNLDCILLMSSTKRCIHFLAKIELFKGFKKIIFSNMGLIPVLLMRRKMIINKLQQNGAISEETAKTLEEIKVMNPNAFPKVTEQLVKDKILVKTKDNKYYLKKYGK